MAEMLGKVRVGECNQCGDCCDNFRAQVLMNKFEAEGTSYIKPAHFPCYEGYILDGKHYCRIYGTRPEHCRSFPQSANQLVDFPRCSYWFKE